MFERVSTLLPLDIQKEFRKAIKCGYWSNGMILSDKQRRTCEHALLFHETNQHCYLH